MRFRVRFQVLLAVMLILGGLLWLLVEQGAITREVAGHLLPLLLLLVGGYYLAIGLRPRWGDDVLLYYQRRGYLSLAGVLIAGGLIWLAASYGWLQEGAIVPLILIGLGVWVLFRQARLRR